MQVQVKKLHKNAKIPEYSIEGDAGLDLTAIDKTSVNKSDHGYVEYDTGLAFEIPEGYVGLLYPRSSISKTGLILANSVGIIDSNYRGSIKFRFKYIPNSKKYDVGDRIGQIVIMPYPKIELKEVEELTITKRNNKGFGSTGK